MIINFKINNERFSHIIKNNILKIYKLDTPDKYFVADFTKKQPQPLPDVPYDKVKLMFHCEILNDGKINILKLEDNFTYEIIN